jgi:hypothetical protein
MAIQGQGNTKIEDLLIKLQRDYKYLFSHLDHTNIDRIYTEYCSIQSAAGETVLDGPSLLMYDDTPTKRLELGWDGSDFIFALYNIAGDVTIELDSNGNALFKGEVLIGTNNKVYIHTSTTNGMIEFLDNLDATKGRLWYSSVSNNIELTAFGNNLDIVGQVIQISANGDAYLDAEGEVTIQTLSGDDINIISDLNLDIDTTGDIYMDFVDMAMTATGDIDIEATTIDLEGSADGVSLGDGRSTNYARFWSDGELSLHGTARVKKEVILNAMSVKLGAAPPTETLKNMGASGNVQIPVLQFSNAAQNDILFEMHMPHDLDDSANVTFKLMWFPGAAWTTGNYMWKLEYLVADKSGADYSTGTPTTISADVTPSNANDSIETDFSTSIPADNDQVIYCHLYRDVASDNGDDVGEVRFVKIEYTSNKLGEAT